MTKELNDNSRELLKLDLFDPLAARLLFGLREQTGGVWDHKEMLRLMIGKRPRTGAAYGPELFLPMPGKKGWNLGHDVWSNIHYGYAGRALFSRDILWQANDRFGGRYSSGDNVSISIGMELWDRYPFGAVPDGAITEAIAAHLEDYKSALANGSSQLRVDSKR